MSKDVIVNVNGVQTEFRRAPGMQPVVGDYVIVDNAVMSSGKYSNGDVLIVDNIWSFEFVLVKKLDSTKVGNGLHANEYTVLQPTGIIIVDGKRYTKMHRRPQAGDQVLITGNGGERHLLRIGSVGTVRDGGVSYASYSVYGKADYAPLTINQRLYGKNLQVVKPVEACERPKWWETPSKMLSTGVPTPSNPLEKRVAELETQVKTLQTEVDALKTPKTSPAPKTLEPFFGPAIARSTRDQIVADAIADWKRLVEIGKSTRKDLDKGPFQHLYYHVASVSVDSVAGVVKVTVTNGHATKYAGDVTKTATAKIAPGEVFNEHIGKIIALYRALGLDVPTKYLHVPAPVGKQLGDIVEFQLLSYPSPSRLKLIDGFASVGSNTANVKSHAAKHGKLVDDSARYRA